MVLQSTFGTELDKTRAANSREDRKPSTERFITFAFVSHLGEGRFVREGLIEDSKVSGSR